MRVLHVTTEYPPLVYGGLGTAVGGLVRASARSGLDVAVLLVGAGAGSAYEPGVAAAPVWQRTSSLKGVLIHAIPHEDAPARAVGFAKAWRPDVVHLHVFWLAHVAWAIREWTGTPIVYTVHSLDRAEYEVGQGPPECLTQWRIQYDLIRTADRVVALTDDERQLVETYCGPMGNRIRIVGNGIDDSRRARRAVIRKSTDGAVHVLYSGRFVERKGVRELLEAIPGVLRHAPATQFVLAGGHRHSSAEDVDRHWMPAACEPHRDRIRFTGWLDEPQLRRWYEWADVLVVPSWYEPFGMVVLEGMLHGLAVVACDIGGPRAILTDGVTGILCPPRDARGLADALVRVIADASLRRRLGRNAARHVRARWLFRNAVAGMCNVYDETIAGRQRAAS